MAAGSGITEPKPGAPIEDVWAFARGLQSAYFEEKQSRKDWANKAADYREALVHAYDAAMEFEGSPEQALVCVVEWLEPVATERERGS